MKSSHIAVEGRTSEKGAPGNPDLRNGKVFISHAAEDRRIAEEVCAALESLGIECWVAPRDIPPGANWGCAIMEAIDQTGIMIVIFSSWANRSPHVVREIERMVSRGGRIIPLRVENVALSKDLEYFLSSCQWLDVTAKSVDRSTHHLVSAIRGAPSLPTRGLQEPKCREHRRGLFRISLLAVAVALVGTGLAFRRPASSSRAVQLQKPADGAHVLGSVYLSWNGEDLDPENLRYELRLENGPTALKQTLARTSSSRADLKGNVSWQVRPVWRNPRGDTRYGSWSERRRFTVYRDALDRILNTRTIRVGTAETGGLFVNSESSKLSGFEIELLRVLGREILKQHGVDADVEIEHVLCSNWQNYFELLETDKSVDLLASGISITEERCRKFNLAFTDPILTYPQVIVAIDGVPVFQNDRLLLRTLGVGSGTTNEDLGRRLVHGDGSRLQLYSESGAYDLMLQDVIEGKIGGALLDKPYAVEKTRRLSEFMQVKFSMQDITQQIEPTVEKERTAYALRQVDTRLLEALNSQLKQREREKRELVRRFFASSEVYLTDL